VLEPEPRSPSLGRAIGGILPHALSLVRVPLGPLFVLALDDAPIVPFAIALVACATDFLDGRFARAFGASSAAGAIFDVAADACFVLCALAGLAWTGRISIACPIATALALGALARSWARSPPRAGHVRGLADRAGHAAGVLNFALVVVASVAPLLGEARSWVLPASVAVALVNLAPLALRARLRS
jgi:phosphatidylglycerophosphate synthase